MSIATVVAAAVAVFLTAVPIAAARASAVSGHAAINCAYSSGLCTEVGNSDDVFGHYVGHDEPSMLFYSHGTAPETTCATTSRADRAAATDPTAPDKSYNFELSGADWLGMAMCDTQSYPEQVKTCPPDSDATSSIPPISPTRGQAYMEMQFYPPGWVPWPTWQVAVGASTCSPTQWCAALNIDSLSLNPVTGQANNTTCLDQVGEEYVNFAFLTQNGKSRAPGQPGRRDDCGRSRPSVKDLFMNPGDHLQVSFTDTPNGVKVRIDRPHHRPVGVHDGEPGERVRAGQVRPTGTSCTAIPYDVPPDVQQRRRRRRGCTWAAGSYNVAFDTEIGHFQFCTGPNPIPAPVRPATQRQPTCPSGNTEGRGRRRTTGRRGRLLLFPGSRGAHYNVTGCTYHQYRVRRRLVSAALAGRQHQDASNAVPVQQPQDRRRTTRSNTSRSGSKPICRRSSRHATTDTGAGCTLIPTTDTRPAGAFYPFYYHAARAAAASGSSGTTSPDKSATSARTASTARCSRSTTRRREGVALPPSLTSGTFSSPTPARRDSRL